MKHDKFVELTFEFGETVFVNTDYIIAYGYLADLGKTAIWLVGEEEQYCNGDQTQKIRNAINNG